MLEDELPEPARGDAEAHVERCARCQTTLQRLVTAHPSTVLLRIESALTDSSDASSDAGEQSFLRRLAFDIRLESSRAGRIAPAESERLPEVAGYELIEEIGRGAVGIVYRARHLELNRMVALKMILAGPFSSPRARQRFRTESQAIARLRHPHIVQVYDIGEQHGCLYLSLELVEGGNLADSIAEGPRPAVESARIVAELAEAVAYAHSHGVIHRDLKPANVLFRSSIGDARADERSASSALPFGELKITDFGIAKVSTEEGPIEAGVTRSGEFLGTPSYTAPEQARGDTREVGPEADVYSLGAILYELLTGRPPFHGASVVDTLLQVAHHVAVPPARLVPGVPRDLDTICSKCLEKNPAKRYATANELAGDLRRFVNGEPILARRIGFAERAWRWARRKPAQAGLLAVGIVTMLAAVSAALWMGSQSAALDREVTAYLRELEQRAALSDWNGARSALERAKARLGDDGSAALQQRVEQGARDLQLVARLEEIRSSRLTITDGMSDFRQNALRADREYTEWLRDTAFGQVNDDAGLVASRIRASHVRSALISALDDWTLCCSYVSNPERATWVQSVARQADTDPTGWLARVRDPVAWNDRAQLEQLASAPGDAQPNVQLLVAMGLQIAALGGDAIPFLTRVQSENPDDFWANMSLAHVLSGNQPKAAVRYYQAAIAIRPRAAVVQNNLGRVLAMGGDTAEALEHFQRALKIDPTFAGAHCNLGLALGLQGRVSEGVEACREAVRLAPDFAVCHTNLGVALAAAERWKESVEELERAIEIDPDIALAHIDLCHALKYVGRIDDAIEHGEIALRLAPNDPAPHTNLGDALTRKGRLQEAVEHYQKAVALSPVQVEARANLCDVLRQLGRVDEAIDFGEQALRLKPDHEIAHASLGMALAQKGRIDEAIVHMERAVAANPANANHHNNLAIGLQSAGRVDEAIEHYQRALEIDPNLANTNGALGTALATQGRWSEAQRALQRYLELASPADPNRAMAQQVLELCASGIELELRIPAILDGRETPKDADEALRFARLCASKRHDVGAARLFASAFTSAPALAEDPRNDDRYTAACCAARTAGAASDDARALSEEERASWRRQARDWLVAELAARERMLESATAVDRAELQYSLVHWTGDPDLSVLRDESAIATLPESERDECRALWRAVEALRRRAEQVQ